MADWGQNRRKIRLGRNIKHGKGTKVAEKCICDCIIASCSFNIEMMRAGMASPVVIENGQMVKLTDFRQAMEKIRNYWLILLLHVGCLNFVQAQEEGWYIGPVLSHHKEVRSRTIYGPGLVDRSSETSFWSVGLRAERQLTRWVGIHIGLNYTRRHYEMAVPFSHCRFLGPTEHCAEYLAHVDRYGYKTVELPVGVTGFLIHSPKFQAYLRFSGVAAVSMQSFYAPFVPKLEYLNLDETHYFGTSLLGNLGVSYSPLPDLRVAVEPFLRIIHRQRIDPILISGYESPNSRFDNRGVRLVVGYRLRSK